ncbi:MAG: polymer-forming cytoskeletal protein [Candidatus Bathyarchaeia archaeon]|jgi:cytoskeletal protein CcmA (bactofilin family)
MSDIHVGRGETAILDRVEGELKIGNHARIEASNGKNVIVTKGVYLEGRAYVNCDLECESLESKTFLSKEISLFSNRERIELKGRHVGRLEVNGNLNVHKQLNVSHSVNVKGSIEADEIDVGGKLDAGTVSCSRIRVGGRADIKGTFEASSVEVGGKIVAGQVKLGDLNVGGEAEVDGGSITGHIRVGGKFISKAPLEFGELLVYGRGFLPANCKGQRLSTFEKSTSAAT